jgi:hypothetical protein
MKDSVFSVARYARYFWQFVALLGNSLAKSRGFVYCNAVFRSFFMPGRIDARQRHILGNQLLAQKRNNCYQASGSHVSEISVPPNQDSIRANAAGTAAYDNYVAFTNHINSLIGFLNCSDYVCHSASLINLTGRAVIIRSSA